MSESLLKHIQRKTELSALEEEKLLSKIKYRTLKKKEQLLKEGEVCDFFCFIEKGCCRIYLINEKGNEQTLQFGIEDWWIVDYMSYNTEKPSAFYIQAIENSEVLIIPKKELEQLFKEIPKLERYFRIVLQKTFAATQMRIKFLFTMSAEERYLHFKNAQPEFVQRVPQYMLASYLDFSAEFMSKIRAGKI
ncbi:Crp/Fnr family transcriptional regulator [Flavobacterium suncheonense]|uniref:Cyclic nucleotide-binding protein n=1 Tax=Flavobacterium suncheonense GH29-5 = DSM 17707 TaxID=1121899 RepID=A0A0A2MCU7_9FLAO|nr:Crp/Fnr family transcriptional regulator [Flavobacterium suncheonense]KGO89451.1 cyclic nucleotide-binding protein [Flavobacterium suncheonense GH29-5 = DSM 17707]